MLGSIATIGTDETVDAVVVATVIKIAPRSCFSTDTLYIETMSSSNDTLGKLSDIPIYCFLLIFMAFGLYMFGRSAGEVIRARASLSWETVEGTVTQSEVKSKSGGRGSGRTYMQSIHYDYTVDGKQYTGDRYCFVPFYSSDSSRARKIVAEYPVGSVVKVYYSPDVPEDSVLIPGPHAGVYFFPAFCLIFVLVPLGLAYGLYYITTRKRLAASLSSSESK